MASDRIVSLAPSATATIAAMGGADRLVGATTHCELEDRDVETIGGWLNPNYDRLSAVDPDLVCTSDALQRDVTEALRERGYEVFHQEPARLSAVIEGFADLGAAIGDPAAGDRLAAQSRERLTAVRSAVEGRDRPVVYCEEWSDPPMAAGNWVPDAVEAAGGQYPFVQAGERSAEVSQAAIESADPDHAVLHVCGFGDRVSPERITAREWAIDAKVHVFDDSLLNQPSPRLLDGIEQLARRLHPEAFVDATGESER